MDPSDPIEVRIVELELRFMKLERELGEISLVVASQQRVIEALKAEAKRRREGDDEAPREPVAGERPPHY